MRKVKIFFVARFGFFALMMIFLSGCCIGDYSRDLGKGYTLEKTNECCVFVMYRNVEPVIEGNMTFYDNRVIKPMVKKLFVTETKIVGYKISNECCYLTTYEKEHETKNGYFIIDKQSGKILEGLDAKSLKKYGIQLQKMKRIL